MKCSDCPVTGGECQGERPGGAAFCALAATGDPVFRAAVVGNSALMGPRPPDPPAPVRPPPAAVEPAPAASPRLPLDTVNRYGMARLSPAMHDRIQSCLYRECNTGCQASRCFWKRDDAGKPRGVSASACLACLQAMDGVTPATAKNS